MSDYRHEGVVAKIDGNKISVSICSASACSSCHAKGSCSGLDQTMKLIEVTSNQQFQIGEKVIVAVSGKNSFHALFLGYLLPLILLILSLVVIHLLGGSDLLMALGSMVTLGFYYFLLYLLRDKISQKFNFHIYKVS